jgi:hypothetical protein
LAFAIKIRSLVVIGEFSLTIKKAPWLVLRGFLYVRGRFSVQKYGPFSGQL